MVASRAHRIGPVDRRTFLFGLVAVAVAACAAPRRHLAAAHGRLSPADLDDGTVDAGADGGFTVADGVHRRSLVAPTRPTLVTEGPASRMIALTIDDGTDEETVAAYVAFVLRTGIHLTFSPNGRNPGWARHADALQPALRSGQVQIANHTWSHLDMVRLGDRAIRDELERNEDWIGATFGVSSKPWFRPPYGSRNRRVDQLAADDGYPLTVLWNGSFGDSRFLTADQLMHEARRWLQRGTIMLGHANHPTVTHLFSEITALIDERGLLPVTLDEMFDGFWDAASGPPPAATTTTGPLARRRSSTTTTAPRRRATTSTSTPPTTATTVKKPAGKPPTSTTTTTTRPPHR